VGPDMREMFDPGFSILPLSGCERQACPIALHFVNARCWHRLGRMSEKDGP